MLQSPVIQLMLENLQKSSKMNILLLEEFKSELKNGKENASIRWKRMNDFSKECGFDHKRSKDDYIPKSLFYMLGFKAENERAVKYQQRTVIYYKESKRVLGSVTTASALPWMNCFIECYQLHNNIIIPPLSFYKK